jgi:hypothetical protein
VILAFSLTYLATVQKNSKVGVKIFPCPEHYLGTKCRETIDLVAAHEQRSSHKHLMGVGWLGNQELPFPQTAQSFGSWSTYSMRGG